MGSYRSFVDLAANLRRQLKDSDEDLKETEWVFDINPAVTLAGAAEEGRLGTAEPVIVDGHEFAYYFHLDLPCSRTDLSEIECDLSYNGRFQVGFQVEGIIQGGEISRKSLSFISKMSRRICPRAPFSISFSLPGNVDPNFCKAEITKEGTLKAIVLRAGLPTACRRYFYQNII